MKKNLIDPTAAFSYALGVSIVHIALAVGLLFVKKADMVKVMEFHEICQEEAQNYVTLMDMFLATHIIAALACSFREIFSAKTNLFAQIMRIIEIFTIPVYLGCFLYSLEMIVLVLIRAHTDDPVATYQPTVPFTAEQMEDGTIAKSTIFLVDKCAKQDFLQF